MDFKNIQIDFDELKVANNENEFMSEIVNLSNELYYNLLLLSGMRESEELLSQKEAIICALLIRIAKLFNSFMTLITARDSIGATFLYRGITDCIIDLGYLIKKNDEELFAEFVKLSLYAEVDKIERIEKNIESRGKILPIERRILSGIEKDIIQSGFTVSEVRSFPSKKNNKWKKLNSSVKIAEQSYDDMYLFSQNTGNNFIHSNWSTLLFQHLEYRDGKYIPKYDNKQIRPQMLLTIQILICQCAHKYISYMFASEEVKEMLSIPFHQTQSKAERIDELHETFLVNLQSKTEHQ